MERITHVYFDQDGVLCDFFYGVARVLGIAPTEIPAHVDTAGWIKTHALPPPFTGVQPVEIMAHLSQEPASFWENLPAKPEAIALFTEVSSVTNLQVAILTRPPQDSEASVQGKKAWVHRHLGKVTIHFTQDKGTFAHPGAVLIDDEPKNTANFIAAGGHAILWPQPWHSDNTNHMTAHAVCRTLLSRLGAI